jgi:hypothetical protein
MLAFLVAVYLNVVCKGPWIVYLCRSIYINPTRLDPQLESAKRSDSAIDPEKIDAGGDEKYLATVHVCGLKFRMYNYS